MERDYQDGGQPLFYIEQPSFRHPSHTGQTVSVKKKTGDRESKNKRKARERDKKKLRENSVSEKKQEGMERKEEKEVLQSSEREEKRKKDQKHAYPVKQEVQETMEYLEGVPHFIRPIVSCETEEGFVEGNVIRMEKDEIVIQEKNKVAPVTVHAKDIVNIHVISL